MTETDRLTGAWRLQTLVQRAGADAVAAQGMIIYCPSGHMSAQILSPGENGDEIAFHSYFGTWSLDAAAAASTHHREANTSPGAPAEVVRHYRLDGQDRLVLRPQGGDGVELTFQRAQPGG